MNRPEYKCACESCANMCRISPCYPTPSDVENLVEAGLLDHLQVSVWVDIEQGVWYDSITPKSTKSTIDHPLARQCVFLSDDGLCKLHDAELKPLEGRLMIHDINNSEEIRREILREYWDTPKGVNLMNKLFPNEHIMNKITMNVEYGSLKYGYKNI